MTCKYCGSKIEMVQGVPCEPRLRRFIPDQSGDTVYLTSDGYHIRGKPAWIGTRGAIRGYKPHWMTCTGDDPFRKLFEDVVR